jgi:hypothetical protein
VDGSLNPDEEMILERLPDGGNGVSNPRLREQLRGWDDDRYYAARDHLVDLGLVALGVGRGGVVRRVPPPQAVEVPVTPEELQQDQLDQVAAARERSLYEPMRNVIAGEWAKDKRMEPLAVEITAQQGRRETGGRFTRPDIVALEVRRFRYFLPRKVLEVITFEVKASYALDVTSVYEALAHRGAATRSYVLAHVPDPTSRQVEIDLIEQAARDHGIGLIVAEDPSSYASWETRFDAMRVEPDPARLDDFIHTQLSDRTKDRIRSEG